MRSIQIDVAGQVHRGTWLPIGPDAIMVGSAHGQRKIVLRGRPPEYAAREALANMVRASNESAVPEPCLEQDEVNGRAVASG